MSEVTRKKLMVIEDSTDYRVLLGRLFAREGYDVKLAVHGQDALEQLRADPANLPDLILLDLMMPVMDGFEFRKMQTAEAGLANIPVILMTAHGDLNTDPQKLGIKIFIRKPVDMNHLLTVVKSNA